MTNFLKIGDVFLVNIGAITINMSNVEFSMKIISFTIGVGYAVWRWVIEYKKNKNGK